MVFQILLCIKDEVRDGEGILKRMRVVDPDAKIPAIASFYRTLKKASDCGYLEVLETKATIGRGRPRQKYRITKAGRRALEAEGRRLGRLADLALSSASESEPQR